MGIPGKSIKVICKVLEDNTWARLYASIPRIRPKTVT